ncbi:hypothetical protein WJ971_08770 [Achromobacter xylosoxidans]
MFLRYAGQSRPAPEIQQCSIPSLSTPSTTSRARSSFATFVQKIDGHFSGSGAVKPI